LSMILCTYFWPITNACCLVMAEDLRGHGKCSVPRSSSSDHSFFTFWAPLALSFIYSKVNKRRIDKQRITFRVPSRGRKGLHSGSMFQYTFFPWVMYSAEGLGSLWITNVTKSSL
jgi:hypothetical protein